MLGLRETSEMDIFGVKPSGYRHPMDPSRWTRRTWQITAVIVLLVLLFVYGIAIHPAP
jgi:hypothetical protein